MMGDDFVRDLSDGNSLFDTVFIWVNTAIIIAFFVFVAVLIIRYIKKQKP